MSYRKRVTHEREILCRFKVETRSYAVRQKVCRKRVVQWSLAERRPYFSYDPFSVILTFPIRERAYLYDPFSARLFCMTLYRQDSVSRPWSVKKSHVSIFSGVYFSESWTHDNIASEQNRARADHASSSYRASTEQPPSKYRATTEQPSSKYRAGATTEQTSGMHCGRTLWGYLNAEICLSWGIFSAFK